MIFYDFYYGILVERIFLWFLWFFTCHICGNGFCSFLLTLLDILMWPDLQCLVVQINHDRFPHSWWVSERNAIWDILYFEIDLYWKSPIHKRRRFVPEPKYTDFQQRISIFNFGKDFYFYFCVKVSNRIWLLGELRV